MKDSKYYFELFLKQRRVILTILLVVVAGVPLLLAAHSRTSVNCQAIGGEVRADCESSSLEELDAAAFGDTAQEIADVDNISGCSLHGVTGGSEVCPQSPFEPPHGGYYTDQ